MAPSLAPQMASTYSKKWSERRDLNPRSLDPQSDSGGLPGWLVGGYVVDLRELSLGIGSYHSSPVDAGFPFGSLRNEANGLSRVARRAVNRNSHSLSHGEDPAGAAPGVSARL